MLNERHIPVLRSFAAIMDNLSRDAGRATYEGCCWKRKQGRARCEWADVVFAQLFFENADL